MNHVDENAVAVRGISWMILNTITGRVIVFAVQVALGWLLSARDFGLYALALSVSNALGSMRNGGTAELLRQRGARYGEEWMTVAQRAGEFTRQVVQQVFEAQCAGRGILSAFGRYLVAHRLHRTFISAWHIREHLSLQACH